MTLQNKIAINNMRLEGHSPSVIAATLGLSAGTVRAHIHRYPEIPNTSSARTAVNPCFKQKNAERKSSVRMLAEWYGGTPTVTWRTAKPITILPANTAERSSSAMVTKTENTAAVPATLRQDKQDKYAAENMMLYRTSLALFKSLAEDGTFTEKEYCKISTMLSRKYGLSSGSIFAESA